MCTAFLQVLALIIGKKAQERFKQHARSTSHREGVMKIEQMKQPGIDAQLSTQLKQSQMLHRKMLLTKLSSLRFLVRQGMAIRGHDEVEGNLPYSRKICRGIKFGALADRSTYRQIKIRQYLIHVYIPHAHARSMQRAQTHINGRGQ